MRVPAAWSSAEAKALMQRVQRAANPGFFVLVALALGFLTAALTQAVGLSLALGAFLAGLLVSESSVANETMNHLPPSPRCLRRPLLRHHGILVNPRIIVSQPSLLLMIVAMVCRGQVRDLVAGGQLVPLPEHHCPMVGMGLTQIGEFSYVLVRVAREAHIVDGDIYNTTLAASVLTILINGLLIRFVPKVFVASPATT